MLTPFDAADAPIVAAWPASADECRQWCSQPEAPADVVAGWGTAADVVALALRDGGELVGYGELWIDDDESEVELARIIVAPAHRGRGIGRRLVGALVTEAGRRHPVIIMRVRPGNEPALRCYAAAGFTRVPAAEADAWNSAQPTAYVWLRFSGDGAGPHRVAR